MFRVMTFVVVLFSCPSATFTARRRLDDSAFFDVMTGKWMSTGSQTPAKTPTAPTSPTPTKVRKTTSLCTPLWGQCGGAGWLEGHCCEGACKCNRINSQFSRCDPPQRRFSCSSQPLYAKTGASIIKEAESSLKALLKTQGLVPKLSTSIFECQPMWGQCGGTGWKKSTCCVGHCSCEILIGVPLSLCRPPTGTFSCDVTQTNAPTPARRTHYPTSAPTVPTSAPTVAPTSCGGIELEMPTLFVDAFQNFDAKTTNIPEHERKLYLHFPALAEIRIKGDKCTEWFDKEAGLKPTCNFYEGKYAGISGRVPIHVVSKPYMCYPNHAKHRVIQPTAHLENIWTGKIEHLNIVHHMQSPLNSNSLCDNSCAVSHDGVCEDGGKGSSFAVCKLGTDCDDCGVRDIRPTSAPTQAPTYSAIQKSLLHKYRHLKGLVESLTDSPSTPASVRGRLLLLSTTEFKALKTRMGQLFNETSVPQSKGASHHMPSWVMMTMAGKQQKQLEDMNVVRVKQQLRKEKQHQQTEEKQLSAIMDQINQALGVLHPTTSPTAIPTERPTIPPTRPPTRHPTKFPTPPPTSPPTSPPTWWSLRVIVEHPNELKAARKRLSKMTSELEFLRSKFRQDTLKSLDPAHATTTTHHRIDHDSFMKLQNLQAHIQQLRPLLRKATELITLQPSPSPTLMPTTNPTLSPSGMARGLLLVPDVQLATAPYLHAMYLGATSFFNLKPDLDACVAACVSRSTCLAGTYITSHTRHGECWLSHHAFHASPLASTKHSDNGTTSVMLSAIISLTQDASIIGEHAWARRVEIGSGPGSPPCGVPCVSFRLVKMWRLGLPAGTEVTEAEHEEGLVRPVAAHETGCMLRLRVNKCLGLPPHICSTCSHRTSPAQGTDARGLCRTHMIRTICHNFYTPTKAPTVAPTPAVPPTPVPTKESINHRNKRKRMGMMHKRDNCLNGKREDFCAPCLGRVQKACVMCAHKFLAPKGICEEQPASFYCSENAPTIQVNKSSPTSIGAPNSSRGYSDSATHYGHFVNHPLPESEDKSDDDGAQASFRLELQQMRKKLQNKSEEEREARGFTLEPTRSPTSKPTMKTKYMTEDEVLRMYKMRYDLEQEKLKEADEAVREADPVEARKYAAEAKQYSQQPR